MGEFKEEATNLTHCHKHRSALRSALWSAKQVGRFSDCVGPCGQLVPY